MIRGDAGPAMNSIDRPKLILLRLRVDSELMDKSIMVSTLFRSLLYLNNCVE